MQWIFAESAIESSSLKKTSDKNSIILFLFHLISNACTSKNMQQVVSNNVLMRSYENIFNHLIWFSICRARREMGHCAHMHVSASFSFYPANPRRALSTITARLLLFRQVKSVGCRYGVMTVLEVVTRLFAEKSRS